MTHRFVVLARSARDIGLGGRAPRWCRRLNATHYRCGCCGRGSVFCAPTKRVDCHLERGDCPRCNATFEVRIAPGIIDDLEYWKANVRRIYCGSPTNQRKEVIDVGKKQSCPAPMPAAKKTKTKKAGKKKY